MALQSALQKLRSLLAGKHRFRRFRAGSPCLMHMRHAFVDIQFHRTTRDIQRLIQTYRIAEQYFASSCLNQGGRKAATEVSMDWRCVGMFKIIGPGIHIDGEGQAFHIKEIDVEQGAYRVTLKA